MTKAIRKLVVTGVAVLMLVVCSVTVFAASQYATPTEAVAGLTGRDVQSIIDERVLTGKTCGTIASEAGVLDTFKAEVFEMQKDILTARVASGTMTQAQADAIIDKIVANQAICDGTGTGCVLSETGYCCMGAGLGLGQGGVGLGRGQGGTGLGQNSTGVGIGQGGTGLGQNRTGVGIGQGGTGRGQGQNSGGGGNSASGGRGGNR